MQSLRARQAKRFDESTDFDDLKKKLKEMFWLRYFYEDGKPMSAHASFAGIHASLAECALAKVSFLA